MYHPFIGKRISSNSIVFDEGNAVGVTDTFGLPKVEYNPDYYMPRCYIDKDHGDDLLVASTMIINSHGDAVTASAYNKQHETAYGNVVTDDGVINILLNSDKVYRYNTRKDYESACKKLHDEEDQIRKSAMDQMPNGFYETRERVLVNSFAMLAGMGM